MVLPRNLNPYQTISAIVQCKAYKDGVSKSDVLDIRDTVEDYNYNGFFLITSSYTKRGLTEHLDRLRNKIWIEWWTRAELEERIVKHQDLLHSYPTIFKISE